MHFGKVTLVGVGLLGGSVGLAIKKRQLARTVVGFVRRAGSAADAVEAGAVDQAGCDLEQAVAGADLVILCTPIGQMVELSTRMASAIKPGAIITDVGSVKAGVVRSLEPIFRRAGGEFIGSHPMAGSEKTGVRAATADLFVDAVCVVTPSARSGRQALSVVESLWSALGSRILRLKPEHHDQLVSRSSHLPYLLAALLANFVLRPGYPPEQGQLCANGFRDTTRVASGSPEMWRDIALANRKHLGRDLARLIRELQNVQRCVVAGNSRRVERFFSDAKIRRDQWLRQAVTRSPE